MVEEILKEEPTNKLTIKFNGIFDFNGLYKVAHDWIVNQNYYFEEKLYKHKVPTPAGAEQDIMWEGWRKVNEYVRYWINVYIKLFDLKEIEVIKEGKKKKLYKARMFIEISGKVELDYSNRFGNSLFGIMLRNFMHKHVWKYTEGRISSIWGDELYYRTLKLHQVIKEFLDMESKGNAYYDMW
jgi:hypothetical protein